MKLIEYTSHCQFATYTPYLAHFGRAMGCLFWSVFIKKLIESLYCFQISNRKLAIATIKTTLITTIQPQCYTHRQFSCRDRWWSFVAMGTVSHIIQCPYRQHHPQGTHFTKALWVYYWNIVQIISAIIMILMIKFGHNFAHVTTALLSWHVQHCDLIWSLFFKQKKHEIFQVLDNKLIKHHGMALRLHNYQAGTIRVTSPYCLYAKSLNLAILYEIKPKNDNYWECLLHT